MKHINTIIYRWQIETYVSTFIFKVVSSWWLSGGAYVTIGKANCWSAAIIFRSILKFTFVKMPNGTNISAFNELEHTLAWSFVHFCTPTLSKGECDYLHMQSGQHGHCVDWMTIYVYRGLDGFVLTVLIAIVKPALRAGDKSLIVSHFAEIVKERRYCTLKLQYCRSVAMPPTVHSNLTDIVQCSTKSASKCEWTPQKTRQRRRRECYVNIFRVGVSVPCNVHSTREQRNWKWYPHCNEVSITLFIFILCVTFHKIIIILSFKFKFQLYRLSLVWFPYWWIKRKSYNIFHNVHQSLSCHYTRRRVD